MTFGNTFLIFSQIIGFDTSSKLSPKETICLKCQILFSGNKETICLKCQILFSGKNKKYVITLSFAVCYAILCKLSKTTCIGNEESKVYVL